MVLLFGVYALYPVGEIEPLNQLVDVKSSNKLMNRSQGGMSRPIYFYFDLRFHSLL